MASEVMSIIILLILEIFLIMVIGPSLSSNELLLQNDNDGNNHNISNHKEINNGIVINHDSENRYC